MNRTQKISLFSVIIVFALSWIQPRWPLEQALHSSLTVLGLIWLVWHTKKHSMKTWDFFAICFFIAIHCIAARWLYSNVPYDEWSIAVFNWSPQQEFGFERNHFDRLIHFFYGVCFIPALTHFVRKQYNTTLRLAFVVGIMLIMCSSLLYEWLEWAIALSLSPDQAEAYNGQQGDMWDAHMDMFLATLGAVLMFPLLKQSSIRTTNSVTVKQPS